MQFRFQVGTGKNVSEFLLNQKLQLMPVVHRASGSKMFKQLLRTSSPLSYCKGIKSPLPILWSHIDIAVLWDILNVSEHHVDIVTQKYTCVYIYVYVCLHVYNRPSLQCKHGG